MVRDKKKLVFINGGKHFWNREKDILLGFLNDFEVFLIINHSIDTNYSIDDIIYFCKEHHIKLKIIDYTTRRASNPFMMIKDFINVLDIIKFNPNFGILFSRSLKKNNFHNLTLRFTAFGFNILGKKI